MIAESIDEGDKVVAEIVSVLFPEQIRFLRKSLLWPECFENARGGARDGGLDPSDLPPSASDDDEEEEEDDEEGQEEEDTVGEPQHEEGQGTALAGDTAHDRAADRTESEGAGSARGEGSDQSVTSLVL